MCDPSDYVWFATIKALAYPGCLGDRYTGQSVNGIQLHSNAPTHISIYLGMLLSHMQNFI